MKIKICLLIALSAWSTLLTACASTPTSADPLPTVAQIAPTTPAASLLSSVDPLPTPLTLSTNPVQQPTLAPTVPVLPTTPPQPVKFEPTTPAEPTPTALTPQPTSTAIACEYQWFFPGSSYCPAGEPVASYAAVQPFEHGLMIWVEETDIFYILFKAGAYPDDTRPVYLTFKDVQLRPGGSVDNRVSEPTPAGFHEPVSGFGLLWRNEIEGADLAFLRSALGWATKPEEGFQTQYQCAQTTTYSWQICYLASHQNSVFGLHWTALVGQVWEEFTP